MPPCLRWVGGPNGSLSSALMSEPRPIQVPSTDGVTVIAHDHGGIGPVVLLSHATGFHGRYWDPIVARLPQGYRYVAIDLRGHGDSIVPDGVSMNWRGMGEDVLAVVDALDAGSVRAVGHSMGGCAVIRAELERPGTIEAAWLCEPIIFPNDAGPARTTEGDSRMAETARKRREVFDSFDAVLERYGSRPPFSAVHPDALRAYVLHGFREQDDGSVILKCRRDTEAAVFEHAQTDTFDHLASVTAPVTVAGSGDGDGPATFAPGVADALPLGTFEYYGDLTHFAPLEDPDRIAAAIAAALGLD